MQLRRRRLMLAGFFCLLAVLVAGVWVIPGLLDWNRYRDGIAALASQQLGRPVHIGGGVSLQLLPQPILTADDVTVEAGLADEHGQPVGIDAIGLRAKALRLRVALGPLLSGKVDARELTLQGADLRLPWPPPAGALGQRPPSWLTGLRARIEDGRLQVGDLVFTGIEGTVTSDPETGTLAASGTGEARVGPNAPPDSSDAFRWRFTARLGRPGRDGSAALDISLDGQDRLRDTGGSFSGQLTADGALSGRVAGRGPDLSLLMPAPSMPWRSDGRLNAAGGLAVADELALEIGGAPARGAVALHVQPRAQLDIAITAGRLDLDAWLPALLAAGSRPLRPGSATRIPTGIDLSAEAATLAGGTLRQLRGGFDLDQGVHLRDVTAILPGEARLEMTGQMTPQARFNGTVMLRAPDLRTTLRWLERQMPAASSSLPPGILHSADLRAQVAADASMADITSLSGRIDDSTLGGSVSFHTATQPATAAAQPNAVVSPARAAVNANLVLDRLVLDPWLPRPEALTAGMAQSALEWLRGIDGDLVLSIGDATWRGTDLGKLALEGTSDAAQVTLKRLDAAPSGAGLSLSGQVGAGFRVTDGRMVVAAADVRPLQPLLAAILPAALGASTERLMHGAGALQVLAAGPPEALAVRGTLDLGDLRLEVQPVVNLAANRWMGPVTLHHPGAPRLLETLGMPGAAAWLGDGSLSLVGQASMSRGRFEMERATLAAGSMRASGQIVVEGRRVFGALGFEMLALPPVDPRSPEPLPIHWMRGWQAALHIDARQVQVGLSPILAQSSADIVVQDGVLRLSQVSAQVPGGIMTGDATLQMAEPPVLSMHLRSNGLALPGALLGTPLDIVAGHMDGAAAVTASGYSPAALLSTLSGSGTVRVQEGLVAGFDLTSAGRAMLDPAAVKATADARTALLQGNTSFSVLNVPFTMEKGVAALDAALSSSAGTGHLAGNVDLQDGSVSLQLTLHPIAIDAPEPRPVLPELGERLTGQASALIRSPELAGLARWLADRP